MKFSVQLVRSVPPEYRGRCLPYAQLKACLKDASPSSSDSGHGAASDGVDSSIVAWRSRVETEAALLGEIVSVGLRTLSAQVEQLTQLQAGALGGSDLERAALAASLVGKEQVMELRVLEGLNLVAEGAERLKVFAGLNHAALYRILKKHDKVLDTHEGIDAILPHVIEQTRLGDATGFAALEDKLCRAFSQSLTCHGLDASPAVTRFAAGLGSRSFGGDGNGRGFEGRPSGLFLPFFLGMTLVLFLMSIALLWLPDNKPGLFDAAYLMANFCLFRLVASLTFCFWGVGAVAMACQHNGINHLFILDVDPRSTVEPSFFFERAALLTSATIFAFTYYVVDFKWLDKGEHHAEAEHELFPAGLLLFAVLVLLWRSRICGRHEWRAVARGLGRTVLAPFFAVTFGDNIIGDILTSLTKPLQDIPAVICYFAASKPLTAAQVQFFVNHNDVCHKDAHLIILPIIAGLPLVFRLMQCCRRYWDTAQRRHLLNLGKYAVSLLGVIIAAATRSDTAVWIISVVSTCYSGSWDVAMDWGLSFKQLTGVDRWLQHGGSDKASSLIYSELDGSAAKSGRHLTFSLWVYWFAIVFDISARFAWVLSLAPITVLSDNVVHREVFKTSMAFVEIWRRSVWAVLRIENEQQTNASGYRALLWVPRELGNVAIKFQDNVELRGVRQRRWRSRPT